MYFPDNFVSLAALSERVARLVKYCVRRVRRARSRPSQAPAAIRRADAGSRGVDGGHEARSARRSASPSGPARYRPGQA